MSMTPTPITDRIAAKVELRESGCQVWTGRTEKGLPVIDMPGGRQRSVRRIVYEHETGEDIGRLNGPRMTCTTPACVCPSHITLAPLRVGISAIAAESARESVLPRHLKYTTAVRSVWDLGRAA